MTDLRRSMALWGGTRRFNWEDLDRKYEQTSEKLGRDEFLAFIEVVSPVLFRADEDLIDTIDRGIRSGWLLPKFEPPPDPQRRPSGFTGGGFAASPSPESQARRELERVWRVVKPKDRSEALAYLALLLSLLQLVQGAVSMSEVQELHVNVHVTTPAPPAPDSSGEPGVRLLPLAPPLNEHEPPGPASA